MKWRVDIEYEDGSFTEPRRIAFQAVYDGEPYHGYETKREALEAFCYGQVAMREMLKEREAEQKKEEGWDKAIKEAKEKYGYGKPEERIDVVRDFSPKEEAEQKKGEEKEVKVDMSKETRKRLEKLAPMSIIKIGWKAEAETSPYDGEMTRVQFNEVIDGYPTKDEALIAFVEEQKGKKYGDNFLPPEGYTNGKERKIMERLGKIENRLTEIEGVLSSIGSPDYNLRKKVEAIEAQTDKKDIEEVNNTLVNGNNGKSQAKCPKNCGWKIYEYKASKPINYCPNCGTKVEY